jgi:hypothetical protein
VSEFSLSVALFSPFIAPLLCSTIKAGRVLLAGLCPLFYDIRPTGAWGAPRRELGRKEGAPWGAGRLKDASI